AVAWCAVCVCDRVTDELSDRAAGVGGVCFEETTVLGAERNLSALDDVMLLHMLDCPQTRAGHVHFCCERRSVLYRTSAQQQHRGHVGFRRRASRSVSMPGFTATSLWRCILSWYLGSAFWRAARFPAASTSSFRGGRYRRGSRVWRSYRPTWARWKSWA